LINITGNVNLGLHEINDAASVVYELVSVDANIILGSVVDPEMGDEIMVTVIATGFDSDADEEEVPAAAAYRQDALRAGKMKNLYHYQQQEPVAKKPELKQSVVGHERSVVHDKMLVEGVGQAASYSFESEQLVEMRSAPSAHYQQGLMPKLDASLHTIDVNDLDAPAFLRKKVEAENR